jgi:hypothetical protein
VRLGREFDALRVAFSLGTFFWRSKSKVPRRRGETREVDFAVGFVGFKVVSTSWYPLTRMMFCMPLPRGGREEGLPGQALLHLQGHPGKHGLRLPSGPDTAAARLNSRFANVKSLRQPGA